MSTSMDIGGLRGYVTSRAFGGFSIPVPLQSLALRDYCQRRSVVYVLPVNENCFPHSYMVIESLVRDLRGYIGIVLYSMRMLPLQKSRRNAIYNQIIAQKCSMHLVLEDMVIDSVDAINRVEELFLYEKLASGKENTYYNTIA